MKADSISPANKLPYIRTLWASALVVSFLLSVFAAFRGGYVGPDYNLHLSRLPDPSKIFDFSATNPPTYYLLGHALFLLIGRNNAFPITLSIAQVVINVLAMWWFFLYTERRFNSPLIHLGLVFFLAFLPVRIIHATTIGTDSTTIPLFVLLLFLFDRFLSDEGSTVRNAGLLGLGLGLAGWGVPLPKFPHIRPYGFGCSIFLASPFLFLLFRKGGKYKTAAWVAIVILTAVLWTHGNPGGWQFSYRYATILLPWMFLLLAGNGPPKFSLIEFSLFSASVTINALATWQFLWTDQISPRRCLIRIDSPGRSHPYRRETFLLTNGAHVNCKRRTTC